MKRIEAEGEKFCFELQPREKQALSKLLQLYPLIPVSHHQLSKSEPQSEHQKMLEEAFAQQRAEFKEQVKAMLIDPAVFSEQQGRHHLTLAKERMEWLLQVLNDVRVGSWLLIGSPDGPEQTFAKLNNETAPYVWAMQAAVTN